MLWLYAVAAAAPPPPAPRGATGEDLVVHPVPGGAAGGGGPLVVIAGALDARLPPDESRLRAHERVVRQLADSLDPLLPVRFGQAVTDAGELAGLLAPRRADFLAALARVRGCRQVTLRLAGDRSPGEPVAAPPGEVATPGEADPRVAGAASGARPGTRYLRARRRSAAPAPPAAARPLLALLAPHVREERVATAPPPFAATVYHLVERARLEEYLAALAAAVPVSGEGSPAILWSGPWPPWAFAPGLAG